MEEIVAGRQRAHDVFGRLIGPADNVDSLIHQFAGNGLNTRAFDTDAASDRINALVLNLDGNFGTDAGIAGNALDLKQAFVDFRERPDASVRPRIHCRYGTG